MEAERDAVVESLARAMYAHGGWSEPWEKAPLARRGFWLSYAECAVDHLRRLDAGVV